MGWGIGNVRYRLLQRGEMGLENVKLSVTYRLSQSFFSRLEVFSLKSSSQSVLLKKNFKKKFTKFTLKHLCRSLLNKILGLRQH